MAREWVADSARFEFDQARTEITVLHVDDDPEVMRLMDDFLDQRYEDVSVRTARSGAEALEILEESTIDCIVSDYDMPSMDGIELLERVRERHDTLPFVLFTGKGSETVASEAISKGVTEYMQKQSGTDQYELLGNRILNAVDQYRAREALFESEERYRTVVENSHEGVYIYSGDEFLFANDRIAELTGYEMEELVDVEIWTLLHPDDRERVKNIARQRAADDEEAPSTYEARVLRKDGEVRHCEFAVQEITYEGSFAALGSVRDITERRERQRRLKRFETMVQVSGDPMYTLDEEARFTFVNDRLCEISGYSPEQLLGSSVSMLMTEADVEVGNQVISDLLESEDQSEATFEMDVYTADGDHIECENHIALLPFEDDSFQGTVGVVRDISDRKRRERRLTALHEAANDLERASSAEEVYESLVAAAEDILDFDFVSVDRVEEDVLVMQESTGFDSADGYYQEVPIDADDNLAARAALESETSLVNDLRELDVTPADPEYRSALSIPIGDRGVFQAGSKSVDAFDSIDRELSELLVEHARTALVSIENERQLRAQRRQLERENERLEEFASVVSHDLRNPLTVATGRLQDAMEECDGGTLEEVDRALDRMDRLTRDLLTLARQGNRVEDEEPVSLPRVLHNCWSNVATDGATIQVDTAEIIYADETRLAQIFENLFRNAVEHGLEGDAAPGSGTGDDSVAPADGEMDLRIRIGDLEDGFFVEDDGRGIPDDEVPNVFETGYSSTQQGTGFGLSIVQQVADAHGWEVEVTDGEDGGARFEFRGVRFAGREGEDGE